ncbi:MAG: gliding motility-associated C-terminal domain-containing protein, partial [Candidatus Cloacimonetes bacterium]|nr:gliding motility-associated C-terminal domain-containing protein [Candidatus Cloacimonadota bacterium]
MAFVIWQDTRSSGKTDIYNIYAQKVEMDNGETDYNILPSVNIKLKQNFPNPFNPSGAGRSPGTTISFDIPNGIQEEFKLKIYNIKGQLVKSFKSETNFVVWDGKNLNGKTVSNGLYFYRLESKNYESKAKKMILLK